MTPPATCILTGTIENPPGTPVSGALVRVRTVAPQLLNNGAGAVVNDLVTYSAADGTWSLTLARGLFAQIDIDEMSLAKDVQIPDLATVDLSALTLYNRGTLTPATIISTQGPSAGGDLTGAFPNPSVIAFRGIALAADTPGDGKVWVYRSASGTYRLEPFPVLAAVQSVTAGQGIEVTGPTTSPTVAVANGAIVGAMLATGAAATNVGSLGGALSGTLPSPALANDAVTDAKVAPAAAIAWSKISKAGATAADVGALSAGAVIAAINASAESPKIANAQLQDIAQSKVTDLVADLAAKRNTADAIPQADVTGLVAALAAKQDTSAKGAVGGYAGLDGGGKVPLAQLPATVLADGDRGDVTVSGTGTVFTIDSKAVTYAKMQDISATDRLLGRATAGPGVVEEIPLTAAGRALLDDATATDQRTTLGLGTSATRNVAAAGDAAAGEVVKGDDTRLTNARTPTAHVHAQSDITNLVTDLAAKVPTTRTVSTTAPLSGGGALSGNLTITIADATTGAVGVVRLTGDLGGTGASPTVVAVGGQTAANVAAGAVLANAATAVKTALAIVRRDAAGAAALDVTGNITGNVSGTAANVTGVVAIANGGTGQATALAAFDALAPSSAKGDMLIHDGAGTARLAVGANGQVPIADDTQALGVRWGSPGGVGTVTSVATGNGLSGGPITGSGTIDLALAGGGGLSKTLGSGTQLGIAAGGVTDAMLATAKPPTTRLISTTAPLTGGGDLSADRTLAVSGATTIARGVVMLAGDLGGTADVPSVTAVGGQTAANVAAGAVLANAATSANTPNTIVKRGASGEITVGFLAAANADIAGTLVAGDVEASGDIVCVDVWAGGVYGQIHDKGGQVFDVTAWGAVGDNATDCTSAIGNAITAMAGKGGILYFPPGIYRFTTLTIATAGIELRGAGRGATTLRTTTTAATAITVSAADCAFRDLTLDVAGSAIAPQVTMFTTGARTFLERVSFQKWSTGLSVAGFITLRDCAFTLPATGAVAAIFGGNNGIDARDVTVGTLASKITVVTGIDLYASGESRTFVNCGVYLTGAAGTALRGSSANATFTDCEFVGAGTGRAIDAANSNLTFTGGRAWGGANAVQLTGIALSTFRANGTIFSAYNDSEQNASGATIFLDNNGWTYLDNVVVGAPNTGFPCIHGESVSCALRYHGGQLRLINGLHTATYGIAWNSDGACELEQVGTYGVASIRTFVGAITETVASAPNVDLYGTMRVTGTATINTIPYVRQSGPITLISVDGFKLGTSDNIAIAAEIMAGTSITLTYDNVAEKWIPSESIHGAPWTQDSIAVGGGGLHLDTLSTFKYVASTNRMGVGTATPLGTVHAVSANTDPAVIAQRVANAGGVEGRRCNGTLASPTAVTSGQNISAFTTSGYDGTNYSPDVGGVVVSAAENWSATAHGSYVEIATTAAGTTARTVRMRITDTGNVGLGTIATAPAATLDIGGSLATRVSAITLTNGLNSNISGLNAAFARITGPTAGFSLGGFANGSNGRILRVYNTVSQTMTVVNEDASSTAANRITTLTGANVALRVNSPSFATFIYDATASRWILCATN